MWISQKIVDYAIWYYLKYYPSPNKLRFKLKLKFWPDSENGEKYGGISDEEIDYIVEEKLKNIIVEEDVINAKIRWYLARWKSMLYIKQKLFERQERKELIEKCLWKVFIDGEDDQIKKEFEKLKSKYNREKVIERLIRKWFRYGDILKIID